MGPIAAVAISLAFGPVHGPAAALHPLPTTLPVHAVVREAPALPTLDVVSYAVHDVASDTELASREGDRRRAMASVTKVMTALLVTESTEPDETVTISANAAATPIGYVGQPEILQGEVWTVDELLANLIVQSGNDAAVALAEHVAGSVTGFIDLMNQRALELGMVDTAYRNPNGLDTAGHFQSARDLIRLGLSAIDSDWLLRITRIKGVTFKPGGRVVEVHSTNRLIGTFPGALGIKTGDTAEARQVLLSLLDTGVHRYLTVVMGAQSHTRETAKLLAWTMTAAGPYDHLHAALAGTDDESLVAEHTRARLAATLPP